MTPKRSEYTRPDLEIISNLIQPNSTVLDLGCGAGDLLKKLIDEKNVQGHGVELMEEYVTECIVKGVPVIHSDLNEGLGDYNDNSFDYIVLSQTLQQIRHPQNILKEMLRVGHVGVIGFLNFGYWRVRHYLAFRGAMPKSKALPFEWYDTPNIHLSTIKDFRKLCEKFGYRIIEQINIVNKKRGLILPNLLPNSFAEVAVFVVKPATSDSSSSLKKSAAC